MDADVVSMATFRSVRLPLLALLFSELIEVPLLRNGDILILHRLRFDTEEDPSSTDARSLMMMVAVSMATSTSVRLPLLALLFSELIEVRLPRNGGISVPLNFHRLRFGIEEDPSSTDARLLLLPPPPLLSVPPPLLAPPVLLLASSFHAVRMIRPSVVCLL